MHVRAVIEIMTDPVGGFPAELLRSLYRASDQGMLALALERFDPDSVDAILDDIVSLLPLDIPGVLYVDAGNDEALRSLIRSAVRVFVFSPRFRFRIEKFGVDPRLVWTVSSAEELLSQLSVDQLVHPGETHSASRPAQVRSRPGESSVPDRSCHEERAPASMQTDDRLITPFKEGFPL